MSDFDRWTVYFLNKAGINERYGMVDDYRSLKAKKIFNDVGTWTLEIDRSSNALVPLTTPGFGIEIYDHETNQTFLRGPIDTREQKYDASTDTLTITGWDDNQYLNWRLAHPSPTESLPPYTSAAYDVRTGQASLIMCDYVNINLGVSAIIARQIPFIVGALNANVGSTITGRARWQVLLPFLQDLAVQGGDIGFRMGRFATGEPQFQTYGPVDRTMDVKFSVAFGNLVGGTIKTTSPKGTYVFAAGSGDLTARVYHESYDPGAQSTWGRREYFLDVSSLTADAELEQAAKKALVEQGEQAEFAVQITDTANQQYGIDYNLGDKVTAIFVGSEPVPNLLVEGGQVQEIVREVELSLTESDSRITPTIGSPERKDVFRIFREIRRLRKELQRRQNN